MLYNFFMEFCYLEEIDSTNKYAKENIKNLSDMTVVYTYNQTNGRGRLNRKWNNTGYDNIYASIVLKPSSEMKEVYSNLTQYLCVVLAKTFEEYNVVPKIKWPNDIILHGKKVCGILTEMSAQFDYINHIVIGIGVNVHNGEFPEEIAHMASSLMLECGGKKFRRAEVIEKILEYFEQYYEIFLQTEDLSALEKEYDSMLVNLHKKVRVLDSKEPFEGTAMGITKKGELVVDTWSSRKLVSSGEVSVRGIYGYV